MSKSINRWLVFNVGCIECGVSSNVVGTYQTSEEADRVAEICNAKLSWREGGQNSFEVFDLYENQEEEYATVIANSAGVQE